MASAMSAGAGLLERERELTRLGDLVARARQGTGATVLVEGEAGIGKTALLRALQDEAPRHGVRALSATGGELELEVPFGLARQLFERTLSAATIEERRLILGGAAAPAAPVLSAASAAPGSGADALAVMHGLYWVCANLTERGPVLLIIDDAHWGDVPSLQWLQYLSARLDDLPVALVVAMRPAEPGGRSKLVQGLLEDAAGELLRLQSLSADSVRVLVRERLTEAEDRFCTACAEAVQGNPFMLNELLRVLEHDGIQGRTDDAAQLGRMRMSTVAHSILRRVARTGDSGVALARAAAVLGPDAELRHAAALAQIEPRAAALAADELAAAGIIAATGPVGFVHPLVRTAVYEEMGPRLRSAEHKRAAAILIAAGSDPMRAAVHLLGAECLGDEWVVERLQEAARTAVSAGAPAAAAEYLRRALAEPPPDELRVALMLELGWALFFVDPSAAAETLQDAQASAGEEAVWLAATIGRAKACSFADRPGECVELLDDAIARSPELDPHTVLELEAERSLWHLFWDADPEPAASSAQLDRLIAGLTGTSKTERRLLAWSAWDRVLAGRDGREATDLAREALGTEPTFLDPELGFEMPTVAGLVLLYGGRFREAAAVFESGRDELQRAGRLVQLAFSYAHLANVAFHCGALREAEADALTGWELAGPFGPALPAWWYLAGSLLQALIARGDLESAERLVAEHSLGERLPAAIAFPLVTLLRGQLRVAQGRLEEGTRDLLAAGEWAERRVFSNPAFVPWRTAVTPALVVLGREQEAQSLTDDGLKRARAFGAPWAIGMSLRAAGMARGKEAGIAVLAESVAVLESSESRLELARSLVEHGAALRRAKRRAEAREPLLRGLDLADRCGAAPLAKRAREELRTLGARPRRERLSGPEALTAAELRVARLAAAGHSNRAIAQELFVTLKTVEAHLARAYRKLDISSRAELAGALAAKSVGSRP